MPKYFFQDGTEFKGEIITMTDGRVLSGPTYTSESKRLFEEGDERIQKPQPKTSPSAKKKVKNG